MYVFKLNMNSKNSTSETIMAILYLEMAFLEWFEKDSGLKFLPCKDDLKSFGQPNLSEKIQNGA